MIVWIVVAGLAGILVGLSRQLNGRLSLSTSALLASFWNHLVGFVTLVISGLFVGGLLPPGAFDAPWLYYLGGPAGVIFVAAGSWIIARIGATSTAMLMISGQMISGVAVDVFEARSPAFWASACGVLLILAGVAINRPPAHKAK